MKKKVYYLNMGIARERELYEKILNWLAESKLNIDTQTSNFTADGRYHIFLVITCTNDESIPSQSP